MKLVICFFEINKYKTIQIYKLILLWMYKEYFYIYLVVYKYKNTLYVTITNTVKKNLFLNS